MELRGLILPGYPGIRFVGNLGGKGPNLVHRNLAAITKNYLKCRRQALGLSQLNGLAQFIEFL